MKLETLFKEAVEQLQKEGCQFAVCGGIAAIIYRPDIRVTGDIDFLISAPQRAVQIATRIIEHFGLTPSPLRLSQLTHAPLMNKKTSPIAVIVGRSETDKAAPGLDFLMPVWPWSKGALERAQDNVISLGETKAPFLTAEDVIIAKLYSAGSPRRAKDWDDIQSIFSSERTLDIDYLAKEISNQKIFIPKHLEKELPKSLMIMMRRNRSQG